MDITFTMSREDAITLAVHCEREIGDLKERLAAFEKDRRDARRAGQTWRAGGVMMEMYLTAKFHVQDTVAVLRSVCDQYETASGRKLR